MEKQQNTHQEEDMIKFSDLKDFYRKCYEEAETNIVKRFERMNTNTSKEFEGVKRNAQKQKYHNEMETKRLERLEDRIQELEKTIHTTVHTTIQKAFEEALLESNCGSFDSVKQRLYGIGVETTNIDDDKSTIATNAFTMSMLKEKELQLNAAKVNLELERKEAERDKRTNLEIKLAKEQVERDAAKKMKAMERAFLAEQKKMDALYRKEMSSKDKECAQLKRELEAAQKEMAARADVPPSRTTRSRSKAKANAANETNEANEAADEVKNE